MTPESRNLNNTQIFDDSYKKHHSSKVVNLCSSKLGLLVNIVLQLVPVKKTFTGENFLRIKRSFSPIFSKFYGNQTYQFKMDSFYLDKLFKSFMYSENYNITVVYSMF